MINQSIDRSINNFNFKPCTNICIYIACTNLFLKEKVLLDNRIKLQGWFTFTSKILHIEPLQLYS